MLNECEPNHEPYMGCSIVHHLKTSYFKVIWEVLLSFLQHNKAEEEASEAALTKATQAPHATAELGLAAPYHATSPLHPTQAQSWRRP